MSLRLPLAYGLVSLAASAMQSMLVTHYVALYTDAYAIGPSWFVAGELLFMAWNALNDALFGHHVRGWSVRRRLSVLDAPAALWTLAFAAFALLPLGSAPALVGLHFCVCLFLYDGFLSYVLLVHASLLADLVADSADRARCNTWASGLSIVGSLSVFFSTLAWDPAHLAPFRAVALVVALVALAALQLSHRALLRVVPPSAPGLPAEEVSARQFVRDVRSHSNFWLFGVCNLIQVFNCHFNSNYLALALAAASFEATLVSTSTLFAAAAIVPHVLVVLVAPLLVWGGLYGLMWGLYAWKVLLCCAFYALGWSQAALATFLMLNKVTSEVVCRHGNLVVAELVDEDTQRHHRTESRASLVYGALALLSKPGQGLAALVGWRLFGTASASSLHVWRVALAVPLLCGAAQLILWQFVSLPKKPAQLKHV